MGASAALMFSNVATCVQVFTPQVHRASLCLCNAPVRNRRNKTARADVIDSLLGRGWGPSWHRLPEAYAQWHIYMTCVSCGLTQVDLTTASIRPGKDADWLLRVQQQILGSIASSAAKVVVHSGTWQHDLDQAR